MDYRRDVLGQKVYVVDPLQVSGSDERSGFNPLAGLNPDRLTITEDIRRIVGALVVRSDPRASFWYDGAAAILAGLIAFLLLYEPGRASLPRLRALLNDTEDLKHAIGYMHGDDRLHGLMQAAASALSVAEETAGGFLANANTATDWLNTASMKAALGADQMRPVDLDALRTGKATVVLVLPTKYLVEHGRFLRLFVESAIGRMTEYDRGRRCLFILDEFFALGALASVEAAAGGLPKYGVTLFPILQDLTQVQRHYPTTWRTFFANSSASLFFGNTEPEDLRFISHLIGTRLEARSPFSRDAGKELKGVAPEAIRSHVEKRVQRGFYDPIFHEQTTIARRMLAFVPGYGPGLSLRLTPYFRSHWFRRYPHTRTHVDR
jgi:type IV secretory pathway TraG/TraD family ATPase VirD4